jgi:hypothetical protein
MYRVMSTDAERREGGKRDILAAIARRPICVHEPCRQLC